MSVRKSYTWPGSFRYFPEFRDSIPHLLRSLLVNGAGYYKCDPRTEPARVRPFGQVAVKFDQTSSCWGGWQPPNALQGTPSQELFEEPRAWHYPGIGAAFIRRPECSSTARNRVLWLPASVSRRSCAGISHKPMKRTVSLRWTTVWVNAANAVPPETIRQSVALPRWTGK